MSTHGLPPYLWRVAETEKPTDAPFLEHLSLLFVPAGVGIVMYVDNVESDLLPMAATILIGTAVTVCITATTAEALHRIIGSPVAGLPRNAIQAVTADARKPGELSYGQRKPSRAGMGVPWTHSLAVAHGNGRGVRGCSVFL
ncbi:CidA/LrgA family protein [Paraburkholderia sp. BL27I4N3]|uniref:CidA/LrgA family protein n=1 Tax=Paraburkholderia sp. BL27I4N3 TaxID=1938805 RepID=UPI000E247875